MFTGFLSGGERMGGHRLGTNLTLESRSVQAFREYPGT